MLDAETGALTLRRLRNLVERLPADSETVAAQGEISRTDRAWSTTDYLLANVIDLIQIGNYQFACAYGSGSNPPKPTPLARPGDQQQPEPKRTQEWPGMTVYTP